MKGNSKFGRYNKICAVLRREEIFTSNGKELSKSMCIQLHLCHLYTLCGKPLILYKNLDITNYIKPAAFFILLEPPIKKGKSCSYGTKTFFMNYV